MRPVRANYLECSCDSDVTRIRITGSADAFEISELLLGNAFHMVSRRCEAPAFFLSGFCKRIFFAGHRTKNTLHVEFPPAVTGPVTAG